MHHGLGYTEPNRHALVVQKLEIKQQPLDVVNKTITCTTEGASRLVWLSKHVQPHEHKHQQQQQQKERIDQLKRGFDHVPSRRFTEVRDLCNPHEGLSKGAFQNRAALKLLEMDALLDDGLTSELRSFVDVCSGPGGFLEFILTRRRFGVQGFGMTLRGQDDFRLDKFNSVAREPAEFVFHPYYGPPGCSSSSSNGDITNPRNRGGFVEYVRQHQPDGVDLVLADGGFSVAGHECEQEQRSWTMIACELLVGIECLRPGGTLVCKVFDCWTEATQRLLARVGQHFDDWCFVFLAQSRPANSERFVLFRGRAKAAPTQWLHQWIASGKEEEGEEEKDSKTLDFICTCNRQYAATQIEFLELLHTALASIPPQTPISKEEWRFGKASHQEIADTWLKLWKYDTRVEACFAPLLDDIKNVSPATNGDEDLLMGCRSASTGRPQTVFYNGKTKMQTVVQHVRVPLSTVWRVVATAQSTTTIRFRLKKQVDTGDGGSPVMNARLWKPQLHLFIE